MPERFLDIAEEIYNFEVRPTDIWIVTFPKSGTTVIQVRILTLLFHTRSAMIPGQDPESDFQLFGDTGFGFGSNKKQNHNTYRGVKIRVLDRESDFQPFGNFRILIRIQ